LVVVPCSVAIGGATNGDLLNLLSQQFDKSNIRLFYHILTSSFFYFNGHFYKQRHRVSMLSLLSPVTGNFFMENVEEMALSNLYLNAEFAPTLVNKHSVLFTLVYCARAICDQKSFLG
jgi:hypothetical protein